MLQNSTLLAIIGLYFLQDTEVLLSVWDIVQAICNGDSYEQGFIAVMAGYGLIASLRVTFRLMQGFYYGVAGCCGEEEERLQYELRHSIVYQDAQSILVMQEGLIAKNIEKQMVRLLKMMCLLLKTEQNNLHIGSRGDHQQAGTNPIQEERL